MRLLMVGVGMVLTCMASSVHAQKTSFLEVFANSNDLECVELNWDGLALHAELSFSGVVFWVSPVISHYSPDLLVTAYPRLGDSPSLEGFAAFGDAQNIVSRPIVEALTGAAAPETYGEKSEWGSGKGSEAGNIKNKTLAFYEAEVFGHPGNVFTWASRALRGETLFDAGIASDFITAIPRAAGEIPARVNEQFQVVQDNQSTTLGGGFSQDALQRIDPVEIVANLFLGEVGALYANSGLGDSISTVSRLIPDSVQEDIVGSVINLGSDAISGLSGSAVEAITGESSDDDDDDNGGGDDDDGGLLPEFDLAGLGTDVVDTVREELGRLTPSAIEARVSQEIAAIRGQVAEVQQLFQTLSTIADPATLASFVPGVSANVIPFEGMCPSDTEPFVPYFMSGVNILSWRFNVPEIVYPQTYIPFSNSTTIGTLFPGGSTNPLGNNPLSTLAEIQNYGPVYPRGGYSLQSHPLKAAAVAAFRAAHIVTRPNQPHVYIHPGPSNHNGFLELDPGYEDFDESDDRRDYTKTYVEPDVDETARWHLVHNEGGEEDQQCARFGSPDVNERITTGNPIKLIGGIANTFTDQWADDKASDDNNYMFSMWRRYRCAPAPEESGGLFGSRVTHLINVRFPSPIEILH